MSEVNWTVYENDGKTVFIRTLENNSQQCCLAEDKQFQQWLRDNEDNLPSDIQAKVDDGTLTIQEAD